MAGGSHHCVSVNKEKQPGTSTATSRSRRVERIVSTSWACSFFAMSIARVRRSTSCVFVALATPCTGQHGTAVSAIQPPVQYNRQFHRPDCTRRCITMYYNIIQHAMHRNRQYSKQHAPDSALQQTVHYNRQCITTDKTKHVVQQVVHFTKYEDNTWDVHSNNRRLQQMH